MKEPRNRKMKRKAPATTPEARAKQQQRRRERSGRDDRAHTPEARAKREQRRRERTQHTCGSGARSVYAFWLNEFIADRLPAVQVDTRTARPYPLGRLYARRFIAHIQTAHQGMILGY